MKLEFNIEGLPCEFSIAPRDSEETPPTIYLDLGHPLDIRPFNNAGRSGPRVSAFRTDDNKGWRLVLHAGDDDSFAIFDVADYVGDEEPVVTVVESP